MKAWIKRHRALSVLVLSLVGLAGCQTGQLGVTNFDRIQLNSRENAYQLEIRAAPTQSTAVFVVKDSAGTPVASISKAGALTVSSVVGSTLNDLDGGSLTLDGTGNTKLQATADNSAILTLGGTPTAASFKLNDSQGTPIAAFRGGAGGIDIPGSVGFLGSGALVLDADGTTSLRATAVHLPILKLGGTPTAAAFTVNDSQGTPIAVLRGGAGNVDIISMLSAQGGETLAGHFVIVTAVPAVVVASTPLAPAGAMQPVSIATAGTVPLTIPSAGRSICIINTGTEVVTFADSGNQVLSAAAALGQYDVLCGWSDGTRFIETSRSNN